MEKRLVDTEIKQVINYIDKCYSLLDKLNPFPMAIIMDWINDKYEPDKLGIRTFYWIINAVKLLYSCRSINYSISQEDLYSINRKFINYYDYNVQKKKELFWFSSACLAYSTLRNINRDHSPNNSHESFERLNEAYQTCFSDLKSDRRFHDILKNLSKLSINDFEYHLAYWVCVALASEEGNYNCPKMKPLFRIAPNRLEKHLALYASKSALANHISLSISAALTALSLEPQLLSKKSSVKVIEQRYEIKKAYEICFNANRTFVELRVVQIISKFGLLQNLPWEELFILSSLPIEYFPDDLSIINKVFDHIESRLVEITKVGAGLISLLDESSPEYPGPAPYFTGFSIVLLIQILSVLKDKIKFLLKRNLDLLDLKSRLKTMEDKIPEIPYDSQEHTFKDLENKYNQAEPQLFLNNLKKNNTMLLFGPPGTGKTTLSGWFVNYINKHLENTEYPKWQLIKLNPNVFLVSDSYSENLENINNIFTALSHIDNCVFLFDEAEELLRKRESDEIRFGRMFTAAMLPYLERLNKTNSFYIFATNYIDKIDDAASRMGRFSIRKGLGWVSDEEIFRFVECEFIGCSEEVKTLLKKELRQKPIRELFELKNIFKERFSGSPTCDLLNTLFQHGWKKYLSQPAIDIHILNCMTYDDFYFNK